MTVRPGELLATDAGTARGHAGTCALCDRDISHGSRYARLLDDQPAHLPCLGYAVRFGLLDSDEGS